MTAEFTMDMPARTIADVFVCVDAAMRAATLGVAKYTLEDHEVFVQSLTCMDCGYDTNDIALMRLHQDTQARRHTIRQRIRRWRAMKRKDPNTIKTL